MAYTDFNSCVRNCDNGICEVTYNSLLYKTEYECKITSASYSLFWWFMIIPVTFVLFCLLWCCCKDKNDIDYKIQSVQKTKKVNKPTNETQKTKVNQNVTGIAPAGQLITLPNGQVGVFIPLTQSQQVQVHQVTLNQAPFYLPQPIYQVYKLQEETVSYLDRAYMPVMPNMQ
ncbi:Hypothetical_protein [Hexamita inflata]|uniref:Hypothetical_protein n=1 Tax=Hexamita inflata TaxID=28002 RepID=A0AA86QRL2_9EUKA|nr:Hypothetical protein HINF_LOCUS49422 [Hexamita inflata]